jgi:hypothetical protein
MRNLLSVSPSVLPQGEILAHLGIHSLSQNREFAVTFKSSSDDHDIRLVDLRSGQTLQTYPISDIWQSACSAEWTLTHVTVRSCHDMGSLEKPEPIILSLPN